jgi:hypothetical protein
MRARFAAAYAGATHIRHPTNRARLLAERLRADTFSLNFFAAKLEARHYDERE